MGKSKTKRAIGKSAMPGLPRPQPVTRLGDKAPLFGAGLFLLVLLVYSRVLGNDFILFDDRDYVTANLHVQ